MIIYIYNKNSINFKRKFVNIYDISQLKQKLYLIIEIDMSNIHYDLYIYI